ncbi:MAG: hypothetical protein WBP61_16810 [Nocardioides sp.]
MRRLLGALALALALTGCGEEDPGPTSTPSDTATSSPADRPAADPVLVHATAAGGETAATVTRLPDDDALAAYVEQFRGGLPGLVTEAADGIAVRDGEVLAAQVVMIGCDVPPGAALTGTGDAVAIVADKVTSPLKQCLAAVTTVALAAVPA